MKRRSDDGISYVKGFPTPWMKPPFPFHPSNESFLIRGVRNDVFSDRDRLLKAAGPLPPKFTRKVGHFLKVDVSNRGSDTSYLAKCVGPAAASQPTGCDTVRSIEVLGVDVTCCGHHLRLMHALATYRRFRHHAGQLAARL